MKAIKIFRPTQLLHTRQAGDTIVEVLIAITIVSTVLAGAFIVSNRSTESVRDSQEHAEALQLLQGQVEQVRDKRQNDPTAIPNGLNNFCFSAANAIATPTFPTLPDPCIHNTLYRIVITKSPVDPNMFIFTARWDSVQGGQSEVQLIYRVYLGS